MSAAAPMTPAGAPAVCARGLSFRYPDGRLALDKVDIEVAPGESIGVIGPNGAGKTTLIEVIAGLHVPSAGEVEVCGRKFSGGGRGGGAGDTEIRRSLGVVFQETEDQLFSPTVFDDVAFGPLHFGLDGPPVRERVTAALRRVGLEGFEDRVPHHLSTGERRRAALASVLSYEPRVLLLDEPTSGLDPRGRREILRLLKDLSDDVHALVIASHDLEFVLRTCARAVLLDAGSVRAAGPTAAILADRALLERHGLEAPLGLRHLDRAGLERLVAEDD